MQLRAVASGLMSDKLELVVDERNKPPSAQTTRQTHIGHKTHIPSSFFHGCNQPPDSAE